VGYSVAYLLHLFDLLTRFNEVNTAVQAYMFIRNMCIKVHDIEF